MKNRYVVYVGVGNLPISKAEEYVKQTKKLFKGFFKKKEKVAYIPVRGEHTQTYIEKL